MSSRKPTRVLPRLLLAVLMAAVGATALPGSPVGAATPPTLPNPDSHGIDLTNWAAADGNSTSQWRLVDATVKTDAIYRNGSKPSIKVRILIPPNYQPNPNLHAPYPVLYLLHGGSGNYDDWSEGGNGDLKNLIAGTAFNGIVVMPEGGATGYYANWLGNADNGASPQWETFHIDQLLPWVDANFNTTKTRAGRAIAGLSMGAWGAIKYAGQHPDKFSAAGGFSGGYNARNINIRNLMSGHMWQGGACLMWANCWDLGYRVNLKENGQIVNDEARQRDYRLGVLFGPYSNYGNVNPYDMASRYTQYGGKLALYSGGNPSGETDMYAYNVEFHNRLNSVGAQHRWCVGSGDHSWTYWRRDLTDFIAFVYGSPIACHYG